MNKGFTLIELVIVIAVIAVLSAIILYSVSQYINKGKDASLQGYLAILVSSGEVYYNSYNSYADPLHLSQNFCNSSVVLNSYNKMPQRQSPSDCPTGTTTPGLCCNLNSLNTAWVACAQEFTNPTLAYCVDSRGAKKDICNSSCTASIPLSLCPDSSTCP